MKRKTSAVLCLDVVDYTRRMSEDADATFLALQRILVEIIKPAVKGNSGRIFKFLGDGALVKFDAATDAINAASDILKQMRSEDLSLRAGIHVGDVMPNGTDLFGDAVNVASRLQATAQPGNCLVSKTTADVAGTSLSVALRPESSLRFKGVPNPIEAFSIDFEGDIKRTKKKRQAESQDIRFAKSKDGTTLAWTSTGEGRKLLVAPNWLRHLEYDWTMNTIAGWLPLLSQSYCLYRFDGRNNGLSERGVQDISLSRIVEDVEAVLNDTKIERLPLFGISFGATVAAAFAALRPDRVSGLVLLGGFAQGLEVRSQPGIAALGQAMMDMSLEGWNDDYPSARDLMAQSFSPAASPHDQRSYAEFMKLAMDHQDWQRIGPLVAGVDITDMLPQISCPALVLHARRDRMHSVDQGRMLASGIENARFVGIETTNNTMPEYDPAWPKALAEIEKFLDGL